MTDKDDGASAPCGILQLSETLSLETGVADGEYLVDQENLGLEVGRDGESQAQIHAGGVVLYGGVEEAVDLGECDDLVELAADLGALHAQDGAVEIDVFAAGQLQVEAGAHLEQASDAPVQLDAPLGRLGDAGQDLEQGGFTGAVAADHADDLARRDLERDVLERPDRLLGAPAATEGSRHGVGNAFAQRLVPHPLADAVALAEAADADRRGAQGRAPELGWAGSDHIGERPFHAAEVQSAAHAENEGDDDARRN